MTANLRKRQLAGFVSACVLAWLAIGITAQGASSCTGALGLLGWQCETVDPAVGTYANSHFAYRADGTALIAYNQTVSSNGGIGKNSSKTVLRYATRTPAGLWSLQTIDGSAGEPGALVFNPATGNPAISYDCFKLAESTGTAWSTQTVVSSKSCKGPALVAYDQAGTAYAAYSDSRDKLVLGKRTGTTWSFQTVNQLASYRSMAIAPDGQPAIAFENFGVSLMFGHRSASGAWQFTTVDPEATGGTNYFISHVTLLYDDTGAATVAYHNGPSVRYARLDPVSNAWTVEVAYASPAPNWYLGPVTLAHANGEPVIAFQVYNQTLGRYQFLVTRKTAGAWTTPSEVASFAESDTLLSTSGAYDPVHGALGISYGSQAVKQLRFAEGPAVVIGQ